MRSCRWVRRAGFGLALLFAGSGAALVYAALTLLPGEGLPPSLLPAPWLPPRAATAAALFVGSLWLGIGALTGWVAAGRRPGRRAADAPPL